MKPGGIVACMGGFCSKRNGCAHYLTDDRETPVERLCGDDAEPADVAAWQRHRELLRIAAQRLLDHQAAGRKCDPHALIWAQGVVRNIKPLGRALTTGEPKHAAR